MEIVADRTSFDIYVNSPKVLQQYGYIKNYCTEEKFIEWKKNETTTDMRWVEIFKHMKSNHIPYIELSQIIEYILCFPGSSAPVERVFSMAKKIWTEESARSLVPTLRAILLVKINMEFNCIDFYKFLKTQPELLRKIGSQEKYEFKKSKQSKSPGAMSAMSVDVTVSDDDD